MFAFMSTKPPKYCKNFKYSTISVTRSWFELFKVTATLWLQMETMPFTCTVVQLQDFMAKKPKRNPNQNYPPSPANKTTKCKVN